MSSIMHRSHLATLLLTVIIAAGSACAGPIKRLYPPKENEPSISIYIVSHGWHTGIVVKRQDIPPDTWPESKDFPDAEYLEVGWGDKVFYQAPKILLRNKLKAILWPTSSVLHIVGFSDSVEAFFPHSEIIELELSQAGFEQLYLYIYHSYAKDGSGESIEMGPGLYGNSRFYLSREKYHAFKTCNVWTAKALRSTGYPITSFYTLPTESVMSQVRKLGKPIRAKQIEH